MSKKLEEMLDSNKLRGIVAKDIEIEGIKELYGEPVSFLGVEPFLAEYGLFTKKTYLVLPHFKEKFKLKDVEYSADSVTVKIEGNENERIEPMDYMHYNDEGSYDFPPFITVKTFDRYLYICSSRFENSEYIKINKNTKKVKAVFEK